MAPLNWHRQIKATEQYFHVVLQEIIKVFHFDLLLVLFIMLCSVALFSKSVDETLVYDYFNNKTHDHANSPLVVLFTTLYKVVLTLTLVCDESY